MTTPLPHSIEFPSFIGIEDWEHFLRDLYCSQDFVLDPRHRTRMESLKITAIRRYKEWKNVEHEYLIAEVSDPDSQYPRYVRIERFAQDPPAPKTGAEKGPLHTISTLSSQSSLALSKKLPASDRVTTMEIWPSVDKCIHNLNCTNSSIILLDLAIVAKLVRDHSEYYRPFKRQCFWYSDMIVAILQHEFPEIQVISRSSSVEQDHSQSAQLDQFDEDSGTYRKVKIYSRRMSMIGEIHTGFKPYKNHIYSSVRLLIDSIHLFTYVAVDLKREGSIDRASTEREGSIDGASAEREGSIDGESREREGSIDGASTEREGSIDRASREREGSIDGASRASREREGASRER
jgi:hypothetical protein